MIIRNKVSSGGGGFSPVNPVFSAKRWRKCVPVQGLAGNKRCPAGEPFKTVETVTGRGSERLLPNAAPDLTRKKLVGEAVEADPRQACFLLVARSQRNLRSVTTIIVVRRLSDLCWPA